jgi:hypothetical protein
MFSFHSRLAGPVKHSTPDPDTVILTCERALTWPCLIGLFGIGLLIASFWLPPVWVYFFLFGLPALLAAFYLAMVRVDVVLSKKNATLAVQSMLLSIPLKPKARPSDFRKFVSF